MNSRSPVRPWHVIVIVAATLLTLCAIEIIGLFKLGSDTNALRASLMDSSPAGWNKKIALHLGGLTTALVRTGLKFVHLGPEPRAAIELLRTVEFGIYRSANRSDCIVGSSALAASDRVMSKRGWERVIVVCNEHELVVIYVPNQPSSRCSNLLCCFAVVNRDTLVVASIKGNPSALLEIARKHLQLEKGS